MLFPSDNTAMPIQRRILRSTATADIIPEDTGAAEARLERHAQWSPLRPLLLPPPPEARKPLEQYQIRSGLQSHWSGRAWSPGEAGWWGQRGPVSPADNLREPGQSLRAPPSLLLLNKEEGGGGGLSFFRQGEDSSGETGHTK